uniref:Testis expressed 53 n=1 Tax=Myotis myotis TaxID=51298 RepID=A0A7J7URX8_MYOMY|nr:testis expressed 53 [Myotis myotis]
MGSKFFCCCCEASKEPPNNAEMNQQNHPRAFDLNASSGRNGGQKRCPHPNNTMMRACTIGRP